MVGLYGLVTRYVATSSTQAEISTSRAGFTNIADFSTCSNERYFMADTIHLGWRGWLAVDRQVDEFMKQPVSKS